MLLCYQVDERLEYDLSSWSSQCLVRGGDLVGRRAWPPDGHVIASRTIRYRAPGPGPRHADGGGPVVRSRAGAQCHRLLVHQLANRSDLLEELGVQATAAEAVEPARAPGDPVGCVPGDGERAIFPPYRDGYDGDDPDRDSSEEQGDGDHDTGHAGLQHFFPAEFIPRGLTPATAGGRGALAGPLLVGHGVPVCPRSELVDRYVRLSPTVPLSGVIRQILEILVHPSRPTARIEPMFPAIRAIPTFGIYRGVTTAGRGINPMTENIPSSWITGMIRIDGVIPSSGAGGG